MQIQARYELIGSLVKDAQRGVEDAVGELYVLFQPLINATIRRCLAKCPDLVPYSEDVAADTYLVFRELIRSFDPHRGNYFTTYMRTRIEQALSRNARKTYLGSTNATSSVEILLSNIPEDYSAMHPDPVGTLLDAIAVRAAVDELPPKQREAVILYHYEGYSQKEAAGRLKITQASFSKRHDRAMSTLRKILDEV